MSHSVIVVPKARVREAFDWNDPTVYRWTVRWKREPGRLVATAQAALESVVMAAAPAGATVLLIWLVALLSPKVSFWVAVVLGILALGDYFGSVVTALRGRATMTWRARAHNRPFLAGIALGCLVWAIVAPGSVLGTGFAGAETGIAAGQWALYFWEHARAVLLLDLPRLLGGRLTSISPTTAPAVAAALGFRILFVLSVVEMAVSAWRRLRSRHALYATVRGAWVWCEPFAGVEGELRREGRLIAPDPPADPIRAIELVKTFQHRAVTGAGRRDR